MLSSSTEVLEFEAVMVLAERDPKVDILLLCKLAFERDE